MLVFITPSHMRFDVVDDDRPPPYSYRARAKIPADNIDDSRVTDDISSLKPSDVAVLGKKHSKEDAEYCISNKIKYIVDIADDKFKTFKHWYFTIPNASAVTTTCRTLKELIQKETGADSYVIPDPTERQRGKPRFEPKDVMKAFYYGSDSNYAKLVWTDIKDVLNKTTKTDVKIMTNVPAHNPKKWKIGKKIPGFYNLPKKDQNKLEDQVKEDFKKLIPWDFDEQGKLVEESDFVLLPVVNDRHSSCKGNNRPIDALQQGRIVLTTPGIPSYSDLAKFLYVGDLHDMYQEMYKHPNQTINKIIKAQEFIDQNYSPSAIAKKWIEVYKTLTPSSIG